MQHVDSRHSETASAASHPPVDVDVVVDADVAQAVVDAPVEVDVNLSPGSRACFQKLCPE